MPVFNNYKVIPWMKISADGDWKVMRLMVENKISGVVKWFTIPELHMMKQPAFRFPPSATTCTKCDTDLREDGSCRFGCTRTSHGT